MLVSQCLIDSVYRGYGAVAGTAWIACSLPLLKAALSWHCIWFAAELSHDACVGKESSSPAKPGAGPGWKKSTVGGDSKWANRSDTDSPDCCHTHRQPVTLRGLSLCPRETCCDYTVLLVALFPHRLVRTAFTAMLTVKWNWAQFGELQRKLHKENDMLHAF